MKKMVEIMRDMFAKRTFIIFLIMTITLAGIAMGEIPRNGNAGERHFEITNSSYLNITLDSSEPINLILESAP